MERDLKPRPTDETAKGLIQDPPVVILCFDNYRGESPEAQNKVFLTTVERSEIAATINRSKDLYPEGNRPKIVCFAGEHKPGAIPGSQIVKAALLKLGTEEGDIETRTTTISTTTDITQLHSYIKENHITRPVAIVTSNDHVQRTEQEIINHFKKHIPSRFKRFIRMLQGKHAQKILELPKIYVVSNSSPELNQLSIPAETINSDLFLRHGHAAKAASLDGTLSGGLTEKTATSLSKIPSWLQRDFIQKIAEAANHQHTPKALRRIKRLKRQFRGGRKNQYIKRNNRKPKEPYTIPPC